MNYYYIQNMDISQKKDWAKEIWYKKSHIWYDSVYTNFKNRQNNSMVLKLELVIGLPFPSPVHHVFSELSTMTHPSWVF